MWPFRNKPEAAAQRLSPHLSPDVLEELLAHPEGEFPAPQRVFIGYNIIQVRDDDVESLSVGITKVIDLVFQNEGVISDASLSLLVVSFGAFVSSRSDPAVACRFVATQLVDAFPSDVKVVFGSGTALFGIWGHPQHPAFGPVFPLFSQRIALLSQMHYGQLREMNL